MDMEVMMPSLDYNFDSNSTTPYITAPSSPQRYANFFYSAPASPTRISAFCGDATPNYADSDHQLHDADFAFDFSGQLERASLPADELFDGGKIKPLKPPLPSFHHDQNRPLDSPTSVRKTAADIEQTREEGGADRRGRERKSNATSSSRERNKGASRSLSPFRVSDLLFDPEMNEEDDHQSRNQNGATSNNTTSSLFSFSSSWYKKWKIKDLLLFRSASESRAKDKEEMKKYSQVKKSREADVKNSSFRSTDSVGSVSSRRRSGPPISAHELHYTVNRAFSEEMRKRTTLPYKQGLWGCLGFNPTLPEISKGISPTPTASFSRS